jgi:DNA polymerase-2
VFDFKSLYPSLIRTFHLDPLAHALAAEGAQRAAAAPAAEGAPRTAAALAAAAPIVAPNGARFAREGAILPGLIDAFLARREAARRRGDRHADQALKIMMNAFFGVLGTPACRFFDPEVANAITTFGQQTLRWTAEAFETAGVRVLYGDTDSVFVQLRGEGPGEAERLRARVETEVGARVEREYGVPPRLTLELELVFARFWLPRVRGGGGGSKKRYAGWLVLPDGRCELVVVGLEAVRRDWPPVARRLQEGMLERLFRDREVAPFVREVAEGVRAGALDRELVYAKRIRKGAVEHYTAAVPPHVQAARKAGRTAGGVVHYVITDGGPEPVLPGRPLPGGIDRRHYLDRVLRPIADAILAELGSSFDEAIGEATQLELI